MTEDIVKADEESNVISVEDIFEKDITYRDLPDDVKEYFQQYINQISKNDVRYKSFFQIVQETKNAITTAYLRDILLEHIVKVKESYKDKEDPNEWVRQVNPAIFTKLDKFIATNRAIIADICDSGGIEDDFEKMQHSNLKAVLTERKIVLESQEPKKSKIIDGEFEVVDDDTD